MKHYNYPHHPKTQRSIVRILILVNIYAIESWISLFMPEYASYLNIVRDLWESVVIYEFFSLIITCCGGYRALTEDLYRTTKHFKPFDLCFDNWAAEDVIFWCRFGILQYCLCQGVCGVLIFIFHMMGAYHDGEFTFTSIYPYIAFIISVSQTWAIYVLVLFYYALDHLDSNTTAGSRFQEFNAVAKFICIKGVVFFVFWQSFFLSIALHIGLLESNMSAVKVQDFFVCIEMLGFAIAHTYAFRVEDFAKYSAAPDDKSQTRVEVLRNAFDVRDISEDVGKYVILKEKQSGGDLMDKEDDFHDL